MACDACVSFLSPWKNMGYQLRAPVFGGRRRATAGGRARSPSTRGRLRAGFSGERGREFGEASPERTRAMRSLACGSSRPGSSWARRRRLPPTWALRAALRFALPPPARRPGGLNTANDTASRTQAIELSLVNSAFLRVRVPSDPPIHVNPRSPSNGSRARLRRVFRHPGISPRDSHG